MQIKLWSVNGHMIKIDGVNRAWGNLIDVLQFQGVCAYFQISMEYLTNFEISREYLTFYPGGYLV
jgi:hypothetical protein